VKDKLSRKALLIDLLAFPVGVAALAAVVGEASAAPTVDPAAVKYQTTPKNGQMCSGCTFYIPAKTKPATATGACKQVKGPISPKGWCTLYAPKS
jgi:hypothetical protein